LALTATGDLLPDSVDKHNFGCGSSQQRSQAKDAFEVNVVGPPSSTELNAHTPKYDQRST